jgi:hypothetical protein
MPVGLLAPARARSSVGSTRRSASFSAWSCMRVSPTGADSTRRDDDAEIAKTICLRLVNRESLRSIKEPPLAFHRRHRSCHNPPMVHRAGSMCFSITGRLSIPPSACQPTFSACAYSSGRYAILSPQSLSILPPPELFPTPGLSPPPALLSPPGPPPLTFIKGSWWTTYLFDQALWVDPTDQTRNWGVFGNVGISDGKPNPTAVAGHVVVTLLVSYTVSENTG